MTRWRAPLLATIGAVAIGLLVYRTWSSRQGVERPSQSAEAVPAAQTPAASSPAAQASTVPAGVSTSEPPGTPAEVSDARSLRSAEDLSTAVQHWLGPKTVLNMWQTDDLARRVVVTVDNLGRSHAPARLWPVLPTPERFKVQEGGRTTRIAAGNDLRYSPFVLMCETADLSTAVDLYRRSYPLLQRTYEELGYPGRSFHARLLEVIDLLLATPEPAQPPEVSLVDVKGPVPSTRPWLRYEFADPALESLAAGQKILVRVGTASQRRLKARLRELRELLRASAERR